MTKSQNVLRPKFAAKKMGLTVRTLYHHVSKGLLPAPIRIGPRSSGWIESELDEVITARMRERDTGQAAGGRAMTLDDRYIAATDIRRFAHMALDQLDEMNDSTCSHRDAARIVTVEEINRMHLLLRSMERLARELEASLEIEATGGACWEGAG